MGTPTRAQSDTRLDYIMFKLYTYGFQRKKDNFYISYYHWKNHLKEQAAEIKYAVEENFKQDLKWDLPQHFRSKVPKSSSSLPRHRTRPRAASLTCSCAVEQYSAFISLTSSSGGATNTSDVLFPCTVDNKIMSLP